MANIAQHKYNIHYVQLFFHSKICPEDVYSIVCAVYSVAELKMEPKMEPVGAGLFLTAALDNKG